MFVGWNFRPYRAYMADIVTALCQKMATISFDLNKLYDDDDGDDDDDVS